MHKVQEKILQDLLHSENLLFSELKPFDMEGSQFTFHLNKLIEEQLVQKNNDGSYSLSVKGKNDANRFDPDSVTPNKQAKISVVFCATRNNKSELLLYKRLKSPFYSCQGFPTGKVRYGESIHETAKRELQEETNLKGEPDIRGIRHYRVYDKTSNELLEDKVMYIFEVKNPIGEVMSNKEGDFQWLKLKDVPAFVTNPLEEFQEIFEIIINFTGEVTFKEINHYTNKF